MEESFDVLSKYSALPAICGRVCPQESQCEYPHKLWQPRAGTDKYRRKTFLAKKFVDGCRLANHNIRFYLYSQRFYILNTSGYLWTCLSAGEPVRGKMYQGH